MKTIHLLLATVLFGAPAFGVGEDSKGGGVPAVQRLRIDLPSEAPRGVPYQLAFSDKMEENSVKVVASAAECNKLFGARWGKEIGEKVDFDTTDLVVVLWTLTGEHPRNWAVTYDYKEGDLSFAYTRVNDPNRERVNLISMGLDLFKVKKGVKVEPKLNR